MKAASCEPAFPVMIASWLSALIPTSSKEPKVELSVIVSTVDDALNGAAIEIRLDEPAETTSACAPSGATMTPSRVVLPVARVTGVEPEENGAE